MQTPIPESSVVEKIDLYLRGKDLAKIGMFEKVTAFAVVFSVHDTTKVLTKCGNTLAIKDNANPEWINPIRVDYLFKVNQEFKVCIYQYNTSFNPDDLDKHTLLGECTFILARLLRNYAQTCLLPLTCTGFADGDRGSVSVYGETVANIRDMIKVTFAALRLSNKEGFFSKSDPFLIISRLHEGHSYRRVWQNYPIKNTLDPCWAETEISLSVLCNGDWQCPLKIEIYDFERSGRHVFMGECMTTTEAILQQGKTLLILDVIEPEKQKKSGNNYSNSGKLKISHVTIVAQPLFTDYIAGGCEINLLIGIDFTGSNGDPDMPNSLHYLDPQQKRLNQYQQAILAVGKILGPYDSDQMYPVYGYGAKLPIPNTNNTQYTPVQHCFALTDGIQNHIYGIDGILRAYTMALQQVILSGPTFFAPLINETIREMESQGNNCTQLTQKYNILLILTDGVINDVEATKTAIVRASQYPLSIVIIGVGNADFTEMNILDGDEKRISANGEFAKRDIVQFVPFRDFVSHGIALLAQQVLQEIPDQFLLYMQQQKIIPNHIAPSHHADNIATATATATVVP